MSAIKLTYSGSFETLSAKIHASFNDVLIKKVSETVAIIKCESLEELHYLQGSDLGDETRILTVEEVIDSNNVSEKLNEPCNEKLVNLSTPDLKKEEEILENPKVNVDNAVLNSVLNSKSPLPQEDPFNYVHNKNFLVLSTLSASILLFVASLF